MKTSAATKIFTLAFSVALAAGCSGTTNETLANANKAKSGAAAGGGGAPSAATVSNVTSSTANGIYKQGSPNVSIQVVFSEPVSVTGLPSLTLNSGGTATYASGSGTATLNFNYIIGLTDNAADLDYNATTSLSGGTIAAVSGTTLSLTLPAPGAAGSLAANKNIVIDNTAPTVTSVTSSTANGTYNASSPNVQIQVVFSEPVTVTGASTQTTLTLSTGTPATTAVEYSSGTGTNTITFSYQIAAGNTSADLDYAATTSLATTATIMDAAGHNAVLTLPAPGAANSLGANKAIVIDTTGPTVTSVNSSTSDGSYSLGQVISIQVNFNEVVTVAGTPTLTLATGTPATTAINYVSGSGSNQLTFTYTVAAGNTSMDLDYSATTALSSGTSIQDAAGNNATLTLPAPGAANSLGANKTIIIDTTAPSVTSVTSSLANGSYTTGQVIPIQVVFSENVIVTGTPTLTLTTGSPATTSVNYSSGSGTTTLTFNYTVAAGNSSADLDYASTGALALSGGTISDLAGNAAGLTLASPGAANSLGANKALVIDTTAPTVTNVTSSTADGSYRSGQSVSIQVVFSENVNVTGTPTLTLATGTPATTAVNYVSGSGTNTLNFTYTVSAGNTSSDLDYNATNALTAGTSIRDAASNDATLTLASPGAAASLGANKAIIIDTTAPTVSNVTSSTANGTYGTGAGISIQVVFNENVTVAGTPTLTLSTGTPATTAVNYTSGSGTNTLTFTYTVAASNSSADLDYNATNALTAGTSIQDAAGNNATLTLATPGAANSLGANKAIIVDTSVPQITNVTSSTANGTYKAGSPDVSIQVTFSANVDITGAPTLTLNSGGTATCGAATNVATMNCTYTIGAGDNAADLDYASISALALSGGTIKKASLTTDANLALNAPGTAGSLGANKAIVIDNTGPTVTSVTSSTADGSYRAGQTVAVQVVFSEVVTVTGTPTLTLSTGTPATTAVNYASGSGSNTLVFNYTISAGNSSSDLDYATTGSLSLAGGTIQDSVANNATLTLASPGAANSLAANKAIVIDTAAPTVTNVTSSTANGTYGITGTVSIQVTFSETVSVTGTPQLTLSTGTPATTAVNYVSGSGSATLNFTYTVASGNASADLDYASTGALSAGTSIQDAAGNNATLTLASPGAANSLGSNKALVIDGVVPTVTSVTSSTADGRYSPGQSISIQVVFSETVNVGGTPTLTLSTGTPATTAVNYASGSGSNTLTFTYTIAANNSSADLDYANTTALALAGGTIRDVATNDATLTLASPGAANSLGANKAIVIDSAVPTITAGAALDLDNNGKIDTYRLTFSENMKDDSFPGYAANALGTVTTNWDVSGRSNVRLVHGTAVTGATDTANDNIIYVRFDESASACNSGTQTGCDTGAKPDVTMTVAGFTDTAGNQLAIFGTFALTEADAATPKTIGATAPSNTTARVIFTESVQAATAECGAGSSQSGVNCNTRYTITGGGGLTVTSAIMLGGAGTDGTTVVLTTSSQTASQSYTVTVTTAVVQDLASNTVVSPYNTATFTGTLPAIVMSSATATNNTTVQVVFNQTIRATTAECSSTGACAAIWTIGGLTVSNAVMSGGAGVNGTTVNLTTTSHTSSTPNGYTVTATSGVITDPGTTVNCSSPNNTATFTGDVLPTVVSAVSVNATTVDVTFSEAVQWNALANGALLNTNYSITTLGTPSAANAQTVATVVRLTTAAQTASTNYTLTVSNVRDQTGNTISGGNTANFTGLEEIKVLSAAKVNATVFSLTFSKAFAVGGGNNAANNINNYSFPAGLNSPVICTSAQDAACPASYTAGATVMYFKSGSAPASGAYTIVAATAVGSPSGALGCILNDGGTSPGNCLQTNPNDRATVSFGLPTGFGDGPVYTDPFNDSVTFAGQVIQYNSKLLIGPNNYDSGLFQTDISLLNSTSITLDADSVTAGNQPFGRRILTGTITASTASTAVTGSGTAFTTEVVVGQYIFTGTTSAPTRIGRVSSIGSDTSLTLSANAANNASGVAAYAGIFESCSTSGTIPNCTGANSRVLAGIDYMYAGCYDNSSPFAASTLTGSACTSAGGTEYLFIVGFNTVANTDGYQSNWNTTSTTSPFVFTNHVVGLSNFDQRTFRAMSVIIFKGWIYQASQHQAGTAAVRWNRFNPNGSTIVDLNGRYLTKVGEQGTINNGQGASATGLISIDVMHEHDNDGAGANESQLYIANGGSCGINGAPDTNCLNNARTGNTRGDGGVLRTVLAVSGATPPTQCSDAADCDTKWEDVTPTSAKWLAYMSKALPQDARGDGTCGAPFAGATDDWDCLVPGNTILPNIKAVPKMVNFNGDLYMIRNACTTQSVQQLTATVKSTCPSGNEKPQLWRLNAGQGNTAANARTNWTLVAENGSTGRTDMTGATWTGGTTQSTKTANNTEITLLVVNGNRLYIGYDNGTNGVNIWRTKSSVTQAVNESDFEAICQTGNSCSTAAYQFGLNQSVTKVFDALSVNDAGTDYLIMTSRTGTAPIQIYRTNNN